MIVREAVEVESATVCTLQSNALCAQIGDEVQFANGIVRMQIDTGILDNASGVRGWVTRTAEAAGCPVFFRRDRGDRDRRGGGKDSKDRYGGKDREDRYPY